MGSANQVVARFIIDHGVLEVHDARRRFDDSRALDVARRACNVAFEQPHAVAQQHGDHVI
jgi:hypothetical protein